MMAQREHRRAGERRQRQESVLRQGESRTRLRVPIEEQGRQVAQLQQGGRQGKAELPARGPIREGQTVGPGGLSVSVNRRAQYQGTSQRNGAYLFSEYTQVRGGVGHGRLTGRDNDVRGVYGDGHITGHSYQYTASYRYEPTAYDAYGGAPLSTRLPHRYDGQLPTYSQHQTNHALSWDEVGGQPGGEPESHYASRPAYRAPNNISKTVSRGIQCSIVTTQTPLGPRNKTRGASRHHHHQQQQQQQRPVDYAGLQVEAMASSVGRHPPPPQNHDTYNRQDNGSGGGLFGGMFSGLGSLLGGDRAAGAVREETQELPLNRRTNRRQNDDDRYTYGAQGGSDEFRYWQFPRVDRQQDIEAYARELDNWKGFWEMELQERSEIQERLRFRLEERAAEREKRMERLHRQQQQSMEREWRRLEAEKDEMRRKEQELEEKQKQIDQQLQQLQHQIQQLLNIDNETADNQQQRSTSDTVPSTSTEGGQEAPRVAEGDATGERERARQMLQELESSLHFKNLTVPSAPCGGRPRPHEV
ncbi:unnamed protein product [Vitrella brassicaformis CCMP3155]|uniref:Uncharacterized protein n=1 Tax=Vitrella brassicaformis (strain CCMP3155) TaxID=1169540 RepID=A0A0G4EEJ7_VITBC|nr:unnamed protein product [Vitrella brassicaformis CCMP3155]|eukprot:CEL93816.1 unnamed protein product [Vitrella brassicaformis CCMP3155]